MKKLNLLLVLLFCQFIVFGKDGKKALPNSLRQPFAFVENNGQIRDGNGNPRKDIDFILKTPDLTLFIGSGALHYQFTKIQGSDATGPLKTDLPKAYHSAEQVILYRLDMILTNANLNATLVKESEQKTQYHYYTQPEDQNGITHVRSYQKIIYQNIYPNIDWVLYAKGQQLKYDFIIHPGAKVSDIQMAYGGAENITLLKNGDLSISTPLGKILEEAPHSYEQQSGQVIDSRFALSGDNNVHFETGDYQGALVIDPGVDWGTYFGGGQDESVSDVDCDAHGNIYVAGSTASSSNIATSGAHQTIFSGANQDAYLAKFDSTGQIIWATYYGNDISAGLPFLTLTEGTSVATDKFGHVYLAGRTSVDSAIATNGAYQSSNGSNSVFQGFLVQFSDNGIRQWGTYYGASIDSSFFLQNLTTFYSIDCDNLGNVFAGGSTDSISSIDTALTTGGAHQTTYGGGQSDGILVKFDSSGNRLWATYYGGSGLDNLFDVVCDTNNNVFIVGGTNSPSGIATSGTFEDTIHSNSGGFLVKLNNLGVRQWGTYLHGGELGAAISLDPFGHIYVAASTGSPIADTFIYTPNCHQSLLETTSQYNAFLIQFNQNDGSRNWGTYYGADQNTFAYSVSCDQYGNVFLGGNTNSYAVLTPGKIATLGSHQDTLNAAPGLNPPPNDAFIVQFDSLGKRKWASYYGGSNDEFNVKVKCSPSGAIYLAGTTLSSTSVATSNIYQNALGGSSDAFLVRWLPNDITLQSVEYQTHDTVCTGLTPLTVQVSNMGRMDKTDTLKISYAFTGLVNGAADTFYTGGLPVGATDTFQLPDLNFPVPGTYELTVFLHYTQDDNNFENDTLHFSLTATNAQPVADIQVNQVGTQYHFSNPSGQSSDNYYWDFGDGDTSTAANPTHEYTATDSYLVTLIITGYCGSDTATKMIHAIGTGTGIGSLSLSGNLTIYPNPAGQTLFIKTAKDIRVKAYTITNVLGQKVLSGDLKSSASIDIRSLASGSYFIKIKTNNGVVNRPFQVLQQ